MITICTCASPPQRANQQLSNQESGAAGRLPPSLVRRYEVYLIPRLNAGTLRMRAITSSHVGKLCKVKVSSSARL